MDSVEIPIQGSRARWPEPGRGDRTDVSDPMRSAGHSRSRGYGGGRPRGGCDARRAYRSRCATYRARRRRGPHPAADRRRTSAAASLGEAARRLTDHEQVRGPRQPHELRPFGTVPQPPCRARHVPMAGYRDGMIVSGSRPRGLVAVHVGQPTPTTEDLVDTAARTDALGSAGLRWQEHGVEPRWLGMETSDCAAALNPSIFHRHGADELQRFLAGARSRQEPALVIATIGDAGDAFPRSVLSRYDASVHLPGLRCSINGRRLPAGSRPTLAAELSAADRDLGLRLLSRPSAAPWWALALSGHTVEPGAGGPSVTYEPEGELRAILVDALGDPVVGMWTPPAGDQRWYVIPDATDWNSVLDWLIHQALPAYVPDALRRARSPQFV